MTGEQARDIYDEAGRQTEGVGIREDGLGNVSARSLGWTERARQNLKRGFERQLSACIAAAAAIGVEWRLS